AVLVVAVADQESGCLAGHRGVPNLLSSPVSRWVSCGSEVNDSTRAQVNDEEQEDRTKQEVVGLDEVARPDRVALVTEECRPRLPARVDIAYRTEVLLDRALRDGNAELEQLAADALGAPKMIVGGHFAD